MLTSRPSVFRVCVMGTQIAFLAAAPILATQREEPLRPEATRQDGSAQAREGTGLSQAALQGTVFQPLRIVETSSGSAAEIRVFSSSAGRSAVVNFQDPILGSVQFLVDSDGTFRTEDGVSVGGDLLEAAWNRQTIPLAGTAHLTRTAGGAEEVATIDYDASEPSISDVPTLPQAHPGQAAGALLSRFKEFSSHLRAAYLTKDSTSRSIQTMGSDFRITGTGGPALQQEKGLPTDGGFVTCVFCGVAVVVYIAAVIDLAACVTIVLCGFAIVAFVAAGWEVAEKCGNCLN